MQLKKLSLESFIRKYSCANQSEYDVLKAAVNRLDPKSGAHKMATEAFEKWKAFEEYLEAGGFEL